MNIPLLIISIRTESNVTEALSSVVIFLVGAERDRKSDWIWGGGGGGGGGKVWGGVVGG